MVVLTPDPLLRANVRRGEYGGKIRAEVGARETWGFHGYPTQRIRVWAVIERRGIGQFSIGNFGDYAAVILDPKQAVAGDAADRDRVEAPFPEHVEDLALATLLRDQQHALLRFRQHDLIRCHAGFALRHVPQVDFDADAAAPAHLAG